jgi:hypothetical protein
VEPVVSTGCQSPCQQKQHHHTLEQTFDHPRPFAKYREK